MKRFVLASCLAAVTAVAQAESPGHHHAKATDQPGRAETTLRWFAAHAAAPTLAHALEALDIERESEGEGGRQHG